VVFAQENSKKKQLKKATSEKNVRKEKVDETAVVFAKENIKKKQMKEMKLTTSERNLKTESAKDSNKNKQVKKKVVYVQTEDMTEDMTRIVEDDNDIILIEDESCSSRNEMVTVKSPKAAKLNVCIFTRVLT